MTYSEEITKTRQKCFLSQKVFGGEFGCSFSSIDRWEGRKSNPYMSAVKKIKEFCENHDLDFNALEEAWTQTGKEE